MKPDTWLEKKQLKHGKYYEGMCRNARIAIWDESKEEFIYFREKFRCLFTETIKHPEDDNGFDLFYPTKELDY